MAYNDQVCKHPICHDLDLPPLQKQPQWSSRCGHILVRSSQKIKIEIDENCQQSSDFYRLLTENNENLSTEIF